MRELIRSSRSNGPLPVCRTLQGGIMVHDHDAVRREMHVQLEAIGTGRHADIKRLHGVLGAECASSAVREHLGAIAEERHNAQC